MREKGAMTLAPGEITGSPPRSRPCCEQYGESYQSLPLMDAPYCFYYSIKGVLCVVVFVG